jgi:predicted molibdopterin-dependent oxidoreductase YjgC
MSDAKTITLTIEGRQVQVPEGTSILEAAKAAGVLVPHYCYHPGLPVAGVCRMCLVEVEKAPKLAPACATAVAEGQVVHVHSDKALEARKGVLEFLLINHPLDCPICDQAGECELQDYTFAEGRSEGRLVEPKRFNPVEDFGGDVLYVTNRCILCTRCVRFMDDVAQEPVLNVSERGDRAVIGKFEGQDLTHPWSGNVVDLCPVGALLSKDFLNKARAWELDRAASVCPNCTQGCNVMVETRDNMVVRLRPRSNEDVNKFFMCDYGRLNYRWMNRTDRLEAPLVRHGDSLAAAERAPSASSAVRRLRSSASKTSRSGPIAPRTSTGRSSSASAAPTLHWRVCVAVMRSCSWTPTHRSSMRVISDAPRRSSSSGRRFRRFCERRMRFCRSPTWWRRKGRSPTSVVACSAFSRRALHPAWRGRAGGCWAICSPEWAKRATTSSPAMCLLPLPRRVPSSPECRTTRWVFVGCQ